MMDLVFFFCLFVIALLSVWKTEEMVLFFPLLFLTYVFKTNVLGVPVNFLEASTIVIFCVWCVFIYQKQKEQVTWGGRVAALGKHIYKFFLPKKKSSWSFLFPIGLFVIASAATLSVIPAEVMFHRGMPVGPEFEIFDTRRIALGILKGWVFVPFLYVIMLLGTLKKEEQRTKMLKAYVVSACVLAVLSLGELFLLENLDRLRGPFESPNYLSMYLAPALVYVLIQLQLFWKRGKRFSSGGFWLIGAAVCLLGFTVLLTKTYASWLGILAALITSTFFLYSTMTRKVVLGTLGLLVLVALGFLWPTDKFQRFFDFQGDSSTAVRMEVYEISLGLLQDNPLMGVGVGQFETQYKLQATEKLGHTPKEWVMLHPHNMFLSFWLFAGFFGFISFIWMLAVFFVRVKGNTLCHWIPLALMVLVLVHGLFDTYFWKNDLVYLFWMLLLLVAVEPRISWLGMKRK